MALRSGKHLELSSNYTPFSSTTTTSAMYNVNMFIVSYIAVVLYFTRQLSCVTTRRIHYCSKISVFQPQNGIAVKQRLSRLHLNWNMHPVSKMHISVSVWKQSLYRCNISSFFSFWKLKATQYLGSITGTLFHFVKKNRDSIKKVRDRTIHKRQAEQAQLDSSAEQSMHVSSPLLFLARRRYKVQCSSVALVFSTWCRRHNVKNQLVFVVSVFPLRSPHLLIVSAHYMVV
jgi:hypothetical protein